MKLKPSYLSDDYGKTSRLYYVLLNVWALLEIFGATPLLFHAFVVGKRGDVVSCIVLVINAILISYFWLNGLKDVVYLYYYHRNKHHREQRENWIEEHCISWRNRLPFVALVYTTRNDFIPDSLYHSMHQSYANYKVFIFDDSSKPEYQKRVDDFAQKYHVQVIRRHSGPKNKAGNLNYGLKHIGPWDYFVALDSDEIIPRDFIRRALPFFEWDAKLGILQCNHISTRNHNKFMRAYKNGVNAHWGTYQSVKENYGVLSMLGHGAMISRKCFDSVGKFPNLVAEDLSFSLEAMFRRWHIRFAQSIICEETFPANFIAFKLRNEKWCMGNMEFLHTYSHKLLTTPLLKWYEKLDIILFTYSLPLTYLFSLFFFINVVWFPAFRVNPEYPLWLIIPTIICFFSPTFNDDFYNARQHKTWFQQFHYALRSFMLYGSMFYTSLHTSIKFSASQSRFIVTPKTSKHYTWWDSIRYNYQEIVFSFFLWAISCIYGYGISAVVLLTLPLLLTPFLTLMSNKK